MSEDVLREGVHVVLVRNPISVINSVGLGFRGGIWSRSLILFVLSASGNKRLSLR